MEFVRFVWKFGPLGGWICFIGAVFWASLEGLPQPGPIRITWHPGPKPGPSGLWPARVRHPGPAFSSSSSGDNLAQV